jgi:DNA polymerase III alpha subunit (gram-positive type)
MKIAITDVETTGLDSDINEIIEIGLVIFDDQTFEILDTLDVKVKPEHPEIFDPGAKQINGYDEKDWQEAMSLEQAIKIYADKTAGTMFCAHNMVFDHTFITKALNKFNLVNNFDWHMVDIFTLAWAKIPHDKMTKWSLKTICEYLEIPPEPTVHRGINGAMVEFEVYKKLMKSS